MNPQESNQHFSSWMSKVSPQTLLRRLIIPGSHNCNSYDLNKPILTIPFHKCQVIPVKQQLQMGIRYLDIRYGSNSPKNMRKLGVDR